MADAESPPQHRAYEAVLREIMPCRLAALRSSQSRERVARHADFAARCEAYNNSRARGDARLDDCDAESVETSGLTFFVPSDSRKPGSLSQRLLHDRWLPLKELLRSREIALGHTMIDVGANIGTTSLPRVALGDFQVIYAAEPAPANYAALVHNIAINGLDGCVLPDHVAIGSENGTVSLELSPKLANHRVVPAGTPPKIDPRRVQVPAATLDRWTSDLAVDLDRVAFVKCDTQGWEGHILRGAGDLLRRRHIAWQFELFPKGLAASGVELDEVLDGLAHSFSRVLSLWNELPGGRVQPTTQLRSALREFFARPDAKAFTDLVLYNCGTA